MKSFKTSKTIKSFESEKLAGEQLYRLSGGMMTIPPKDNKTKGQNGIYNDDGCIPHPFPKPLPPVVIF
ncbi:MAG: hypothetical protein ABIQ31_08485 [Ferruginibacter sp.]